MSCFLKYFLCLKKNLETFKPKEALGEERKERVSEEESKNEERPGKDQ